jgi:hypothetical protein
VGLAAVDSVAMWVLVVAGEFEVATDVEMVGCSVEEL